MRFLVSLVLAESRVALWLARANTSGVAVSSAQLSSCLRAAWPPRGRSWNSERFLIRLRQLTHLRKQFAKAFRRRWGIRWRRLPARAEFVAADLLVRVRSQARTRDTKRGPILGTKNGPRFGDRAGIVGKDEVPKVGTTLGPKNGTTFASFSRPQVRDFFFVDALALRRRPSRDRVSASRATNCAPRRATPPARKSSRDRGGARPGATGSQQLRNAVPTVRAAPALAASATSVTQRVQR